MAWEKMTTHPQQANHPQIDRQHDEVYLDHAATTPLRAGVLDAMLPFLTDQYANPSALYAAGRRVRAALDRARDTVADLLGCQPGEVYFTSGGTEAINMAIKGYMRTQRERGRHLLVSAIEHHAVLHAARSLIPEGFSVEEIPVDVSGQVNVADVAKMIRPDTILVAVMHANNEVGTVQPVQDLAELCLERGIALHVDAVQSVGHLPLAASLSQAAFISISAHKFGGPKGVGALIARRNWRFGSILHGGGQEREKRAGTENVAGVVGMAVALEDTVAQQAEENVELERLAARLRAGLAHIPDTIFSGHPTDRLPGFVHVCFNGVSGESLVLNLDRAGIAAASGSACSSGSTQVSHVLQAMAVPSTYATGALRLTLGCQNSDKDVERVIATLPPLVERLRNISDGGR